MLENGVRHNCNPVTENNLYSAGLQLDGIYRFTNSQFYFQYYSEVQDSDLSGSQHDSLFYELYYASNHLNNLTIDIGKCVQKWGKGYAWNPVGFITLLVIFSESVSLIRFSAGMLLYRGCRMDNSVSSKCSKKSCDSVHWTFTVGSTDFFRFKYNSDDLMNSYF